MKLTDEMLRKGADALRDCWHEMKSPEETVREIWRAMNPLTPQERWNRKNPEKVREADRRWRAK